MKHGDQEYGLASERPPRTAAASSPGASSSWRRRLSGMVVRPGTLALIDQGVVSLTNFLTGLLIGRICTSEEFGLYALGFTIISAAMNLQEALVSTPYTIFSPRLKGRDLRQFTGSTLLHQLTLSCVAMILLGGAAVVLSLGVGPDGLASVVGALILSIVFILLWAHLRRVCLAALKIRRTLLLDASVSVLQLSGLSLVAYFGLLSAPAAYWTIGGACAGATLSLLLRMRGELEMNVRRAVEHLRQDLGTGVWIFLSGFVWVISISLYPWFLAHFHGTGSTGAWAACFGIVNLFNPLFLGMQNFFSPKIAHSFARGDLAALRRSAHRSMLVFGLAMVPVCLVLVGFGGDLVALVYGAKYTGLDSVVGVLALNGLVSALSFAPSRALFTMERADTSTVKSTS